MSTKRMFAETKKACGRLDILVNNAGIYKGEPVGRITEEQFHKETAPGKDVDYASAWMIFKF